MRGRIAPGLAAAIFLTTGLLFPSVSPASGDVGYDSIVAVVVGINHPVDSKPALANATIDAEKFANLISSRGGQVLTLYDEDATRSRVYEALEKYAPALRRQSPGARSLLIFYFAGHGETQGGAGYLVPYGATERRDWISLTTLKQLSSTLGFGHQLFLLGSCFGGTFFHGVNLPVGESRGDTARDSITAQVVLQHLSSPARIAIAAGGADEKIPDGEPGRGSQFGNALVRGLTVRDGTDLMAADIDENGCVSSLELGAYVQGKAYSTINTPKWGVLDQSVQSDVFLCSRKLTRPSSPLGAIFPVRSLYSSEEKGPELFRALTLDDPTPPPRGYVRVPPGSVGIGTDNPETDRDERPAHTVSISHPMWVKTHEVSQREWVSRMGENPSFKKCDQCPVTRVNWYEAVEYANKVSREYGRASCYTIGECMSSRDTLPRPPAGWKRHDGPSCPVEFHGVECEGFRLPTEAEWEYLARQTPILFSNPGQEHLVGRHAWYRANASEPMPVGGKEETSWGLFDLYGNVYEWCGDWYGPYRMGRQSDPTGPSKGATRVMRGGAFTSYWQWVRATDRAYEAPNVRNYAVGFRLVRSAIRRKLVPIGSTPTK